MRARGAFLLLTAATVLCTLWMGWFGAVLNTEVAPQGIVSFELARTQVQSAAILASWDGYARGAAMLVQGVDFLYLLLYPAWLALAAAGLAGSLGGAPGRLGRVVSVAVLFAIPLDAVENYALNMQLLHGADGAMAALAYWCAVPKFALVLAALVYVVTAGCLRLATRRSQQH